MRVAVVGAGSWGTALAIHSARSGNETVLCPRDPAVAASIDRERRHPSRHPDAVFPDGLRAEPGLGAVRSADLVLLAVPSPAVPSVLGGIAEAGGRPALVSAVKGFENFLLSELDFPPPVVLRFVRGRLVDASSEFQPYFDRMIAQERAKLNPLDIDDFKSSDGKLATSASVSATRMFHLRSVKMKVLEIVWSYLYSGREEEAWQTLAETWPAADVDRIRDALLRARARGIRAQVE